jgi:hypothetical protein
MLVTELNSILAAALAGTYTTADAGRSLSSLVGSLGRHVGLLGLLLPLGLHALGLVMPLVALNSFEQHRAILHQVGPHSALLPASTPAPSPITGPL